jgi:hypothetical protein
MAAFEEIERRRKRAKSSYKDAKKHYVRVEGWLPVFRDYAERTGGAVRYFTLCAKDAIDVRYFRIKGVLTYDAKQKAYPTVSFVERDPQDYAVIAESLGTTKLGIRGDLEQILVQPDQNPNNSIKLRKSFPYDIINLDFTGEVVRENDPPYSQTIRAIEKIIELQHGANCETWHMFLTFRACQETANHEADQELRGIVEGNLRNARAREAYGARPLPIDLIRVQYDEFLRVGIIKFLAHSSSQRGYVCLLENSYVYSREPPDGGPPYHIVKLIVRFDSVRAAGHLPNPLDIMAAYENSVPAIFQSHTIDVVAQLEVRGVRQRIMQDLKPVLDELELQRIVE